MSWRARASFSARVTHAVEPLRQHVQEEAADELARLERHGLVPPGALDSAPQRNRLMSEVLRTCAGALEQRGRIYRDVTIT